MVAKQTENEQETAAAPTGQQTAASIVNSLLTDGLSTQLKLKRKYGLTFPPDYNPTNVLMGAYLQLKEINDKNGKCALGTCSQASIANNPMEMVIKGLNMRKKQCYSIVYGGKLQCQVSYHGWRAMTYRYGAKTIDAEVIYERDIFKHYIKNGREVLDGHTQDFTNINLDKIKEAYCFATLANGSQYIEIININQIKATWRKGYGYKENAGTHREFTDIVAKKTVISRARRQIVQQYGDLVMVKSVEHDDDFPGVDVVAEDVKYDIEQYANAQEFPIEPEPEQPQTVIKQKEPTRAMADVMTGQKQKGSASAVDRSWTEGQYMEYVSVLAVIMKSMEDNPYNYIVDGKCSKCGDCCSDILPLLDNKIRRVHKYVRQNGIKESKRLIPVAKPVLGITRPFRDNGKRICTTYEIRPEICRQFICDSEQRAKENRERLKKGRRMFSAREVFFGVN